MSQEITKINWVFVINIEQQKKSISTVLIKSKDLFSAQGKISGVIQKKKKKYLAGFWKSIFVFRVMLGKQHKNELKSIKFPCLEQEEN